MTNKMLFYNLFVILEHLKEKFKTVGTETCFSMPKGFLMMLYSYKQHFLYCMT